jgi:hypothetical protein
MAQSFPNDHYLIEQMANRSRPTISTSQLSVATLFTTSHVLAGGGMNISAVQISHAKIGLAVEFVKFTTTFESLLGKYDPTVADQIRNDPQVADRMLQAMEGEQNLMIFSKLNHGGLFRLIGRSRNAVRYTIGNPRIALQMTRHDIGAALYVPFNLLVIEYAASSVRVEYDLPSSLLGQFGNPDILQVATQLDQKIKRLLDATVRAATL